MSSFTAAPEAVTPGIDVSHHNGDIDWTPIAAAGVSFAYTKATEGIHTVDAKFATNWPDIKDAGLLRGAYHFFHPSRPPEQQADLFLSTIGLLDIGDLPPVLDLEETGTEWEDAPAEQRVGMAMQWLQTVQIKTGRTPVIYTSASFVAERFPDPSPLAAFPLWVAHYTTAAKPKIPAVWDNWTIWQYTEMGSITGLGGAFDLNRFNGTVDDLKKL